MNVGVSIFFGVVGLLQGRKAQKATARAQKAERNIQLAKQRREKRNQLRQARAQRAEIIAQGIGQGGAVTEPTSTTAGAVAGVESQYAYNLSFLDQTSALNQQAFQARQEASVFEGRARVAGAIGTASETIRNK